MGAPRPQRPTKQRRQPEAEEPAVEVADQPPADAPAGPVERARDLSPEEVGFRDEGDSRRKSSRRPGKRR